MPFIQLKINTHIRCPLEMSLHLTCCNQKTTASCFRDVSMIEDHFCCSVLPECLGPSSAVLGLFGLQLNMSSSYAAAISALLTASSSDPPAKPSPHHSPAGSPKPSPSPPAPSLQKHLPEPLGTYDEQQENPADYGIGRQHRINKLQHIG